MAPLSSQGAQDNKRLIVIHSQKKGGFQRFWQRTLGFLDALRFFKEPQGSLEYPTGFFKGILKNPKGSSSQKGSSKNPYDCKYHVTYAGCSKMECIRDFFPLENG